jgi:hypothetical protein
MMYLWGQIRNGAKWCVWPDPILSRSFTVYLGDRHAGNVMLRDNGAYLHIDYGYVLGNQPGMHLCAWPWLAGSD